MADRRASAIWEGDLFEGNGTARLESSGLADALPVSWPSRTEAPAGKTSPEELLAAAHASCFCMALSKQLADRGGEPGRLEASATVTFEPGSGVTRSALEVRVSGTGLSGQAVSEAAEAAKDGCPISQALAGNVELTIRAETR